MWLLEACKVYEENEENKQKNIYRKNSSPGSNEAEKATELGQYDGRPAVKSPDKGGRKMAVKSQERSGGS